MKLLSMVEYVHLRLKDYPHHTIGIDMTMGKGFDTLALAKHCQEVYAFDIQQEALYHTQKVVHGFENVHLILDSHENIDHYVSSFDIAIFNLGYLPGLSHHTTTLLSSTQKALQKAVAMMNEVVFVVVYPGHDEGQKESIWIDDYVKNLDTHLYNVSSYKMLNKKNAPYVIEIQKRKGKDRF